MKFLPKAQLPPDLSHAPSLNAAAQELEQKLKALDYKTLSLSDYGNRYYAFDLRKLTYMLQSYVFMLLWAQFKTQKRFSEMTILDHGGGIGMLSFLAKMVGVKTVIHQDLNPVISEDAKKIAAALGLSIDYYVTGDTAEFVEFVNKNNLNLNLIASRNVIEHVYDLNQFFEATSKIKSDKLLLFLSTTANEKNPLVNWYTKRIQQNFEYKGSPVAWGDKKIDPKNSGYQQRKRIIESEFPKLPEDIAVKLAVTTRGKNKQDILQEVNNYIETGKFPAELKHPTNTCQPETGSWVEHLVPLTEYETMIRNHGFKFSFINGFYNTNYPQNYLNWITPPVNFVIQKLGKNAKVLAPFISIVAEK
jgi:2-polyprenyl-3-methyl-5-hydroxy-6-metoxy-1,4-benzoquinol methylase